MSQFNIEHEWDSEGECNIAITPQEPNWRWSHWDLAGITLHTLSSIVLSIGNGINMLARECQASANYERDLYQQQVERFEQECARAEMAGALEGMWYFDGEPAEPNE